MFAEFAYLIPLYPFLGFLWILGSGLAKKWTRGEMRIGDQTAAYPSIALMVVSWLHAIGVLLELLQKGPGHAYHFAFPWLQVGALSLNFGWLIDGMTAIMLIVVTTVAAMVQIFSYGYMAGDSRFPRFYAYLSLFTMAMLTLVLANNLVELFLAWEIMGLASYLLIGFWFEKPSAMKAAKKAFMVTRVGDVGFFFGIALLLAQTGTADFLGLVVAHPNGDAPAITARGWIPNLAVCAGPRILDNTAPIFTRVEPGAEHGGGHGAAAGSHEAPAGDHAAGSGEHAAEGAGSPAAASNSGEAHRPGAATSTAQPMAGLRAQVMLEDRARTWIALLGLAAVLIFCGSIGKSAQFPLHVWLPDAMEGPTPVSALIHAATMVAAGVYLVARMYPVFDFGGEQVWFGTITFRPLDLVALIGTVTAAMAAFIALTQPDIKRILAFSTCSQLGFMLAALGCGGTVTGHNGEPELMKLGFTSGMFHLMTHAFFKGLLFLGSGSIIHGTGTQDVWEMGAIKKYMPRTAATYMCGYIALAGFPFIAAGFYSKDLILDAAFESRPWVFWTLLATAGLTAFYMTRQMTLVFGEPWSGGPKTADAHGGHGAAGTHGHDVAGHDDHGHDGHGHDAHSHDAHGHDAHAHDVPSSAIASHDDHGHGHHGEPHESGPSMLGPLYLLAVLAIVSGFVGIPGWIPGLPEGWGLAIYPFLHYERPGLDSHVHAHFNPIVFYPGLLVPLVSAAVGWFFYRGRTFLLTRGRTPSGVEVFGYKLSLNKLYFDELYMATLIRTLFVLTSSFKFIDIWVIDAVVRLVGWTGRMSAVAWGYFDKTVIDGIVNLTARMCRFGSDGVRELQSGQVQHYFLVVFGGAMILIWALVQQHVIR